jgi:FAD synthetase
MAFGSFDLLHPGHLHYLSKAEGLGDHLTVVVARDSSIRSIKGRAPIVKQGDRVRLVGSLRIVDRAVIGNRIRKPSDMYRIIGQQRPDVIVFGYDQRVDLPKLRRWLRENRIGAKVVRIRSSLRPRHYKSSKMKKMAFRSAQNILAPKRHH